MYLPDTNTMASAAALVPRYIYGNNCYYYNNCTSNWYRWGRWVLAGILIFIGLLVVLFILFMGRRRRRRSHPISNTGSTPMAYSSNAAPQTENYYGQNQGYTGNQYAPPQAPPPTYGSANEYYGQTSGVAEPQNVYQPNK